MVLSDIVLLFSALQRFSTSHDTPTVHDITYLLEMSHYHEKPTLRQSQTVSAPDHCMRSTVLTKQVSGLSTFHKHPHCALHSSA